MVSCSLENSDDFIAVQNQELCRARMAGIGDLGKHQSGEMKIVLGASALSLRMPPQQDDDKEANREHECQRCRKRRDYRSATAPASGVFERGNRSRLDRPVVFTESTQGAIGKIGTSGSPTLYPIDSTDKVTLFNTGVDSSAMPLAGGSNDPHWTILSGPSGTFPAPALVVASPPGDYASNSNSRWVWENASGNAGNNSPYTFRETFDLTGDNPNTATISGAWGVDNDGMILLNGSTPVGTGALSLSGSGDNWGSFHKFTITGGFVAGVNTLDFVATDTGNPGGLNVNSLVGTVSRATSQGPDLITTASDGRSGLQRTTQEQSAN